MSDLESIKQMAELLKSGATMLEEHCPECGSLLFRVKGEVLCPKCKKRVITVKEGEESSVVISPLLDEVEKITLTKIQEVSKQMIEERDIAKLERLSSLLLNYLEALEKMKNFQRK